MVVTCAKAAGGRDGTLRKLNGGEFVSSVDGAGSERKRQDVAKTLDLTLRSTGNYRRVKHGKKDSRIMYVASSWFIYFQIPF